MLKKCLCLILLVIMTFSVTTGIVCQAANTTLVQDFDLIFNGHMEWLGTSLARWQNASYVPTASNLVRPGSTGTKSLVQTTTASSDRVIFTQTDTYCGFIPGETYTMSFWAYTDDLVAGNTANRRPAPGMKIEFNGTTFSKSLDIYDFQLGQWEYRETTFVCPENYTSVVIHARHDGAGTVYYDDLKITGPVTQEKATELSYFKDAYQRAYDFSQQSTTAQEEHFANATLGSNTNHVSNSSFSSSSGWTFNGYDSATISRTTEDYYSSSYSLKISASNYTSYSDAHALTSFTPSSGDTFVAGAEYIVSGYIKTNGITTADPITIGNGGAYYDALLNYQDGKQVASTNFTTKVYDTGGNWQEMKYVFTMPENVVSITLRLRLNVGYGGSGTVYFDDVKFGRVYDGNPLSLSTKHTFYYTEDGVVDATANIAGTIQSGSTLTFSVLDSNGTVVYTKNVTSVQTTNTVTFDVMTLATKKAQYAMKVDYKDSSGNLLSTESKRIYRYDRPTAINENMNYVDPVTGEEVYPHFMYGQMYTTTEDLESAGLTFMRADFNLSSDDSIQQSLDDAYSKGIKVLMQLYALPAGHPTMLKRTRDVVTKFHTHPAVGAWMLMDEPSLHIGENGIRTYDEMLYYLEEGYKAIREIDDVHPIYNIETTGNYYDSYERTGQMCDIFAIDPYPASTKAAISGSLITATTRARNAVYDERPVWVLGLASDWSGDYGHPFVTSTMLRFQIYDALWAGAKGTGHYLSPPYDDKDTVQNYPDIYETENTRRYNETMIKSAQSGEIKELFEHFALGRHEVFAENTGNGYKWRLWYKDNGDMYLAIASQISSSNTVLETTTTNIKLVDDKGFSIDGYDAELVNGLSEEEIHSSDNTVAITLKGGEVSLYKITPAENMNYNYSGEGVPVAFGDDLLNESGDCESGTPSGFAADSSMNTSASRSTDRSCGSGSYSVKITNGWWNSGNTTTYQNTSLSLDSGASYKLSFNMYSTGFSSSSLPTVKMTYNNSGSSSKTFTPYNVQINNGEWTKYDLIFNVPTDATRGSLVFTFPKSATVYLDNISIKKVLAFSEHEMLKNTSFEFFTANANYTGSNGTQPTGGWDTGSGQFANFFVPPMSEVVANSGNHCIGLAAVKDTNMLRQPTIPIEYGKTYEISFWFNAKNLTDSSTYPRIQLQTSGTVGYGQAGGHETKYFDFTDAYTNKDNGWVKYTAEYTVPEYQEGYDITQANLQFKMMGSSSLKGYFDDVSFRMKPEKTGFTLRNLSYETSSTSITVEYDITNHFTESDGTVIYAFYDANGRFVKMETEDAVLDALHIERTFDKVDFAKMKVFIWDSVTGMTPYSNMIEY